MEDTVNNPATQYRQLDIQTSVHNASPHQLIEMLFEGARDRINQAQGHVERKDHERRTQAINACIDIISGLQASLDHEQGGELATNLDGLYDYMQRRLFRANADNDAQALTEVADLINTLRSAWVSIRPADQVSAG